jgi:hypothetical protein
VSLEESQEGAEVSRWVRGLNEEKKTRVLGIYDLGFVCKCGEVERNNLQPNETENKNKRRGEEWNSGVTYSYFRLLDRLSTRLEWEDRSHIALLNPSQSKPLSR